MKWIWQINTDTHTQPFYGPFSGTTQVSWCQKRTSGLYVQGKINRGRHTDHPSGLTSAHLHHPPFFYRPDALPAAQPTVSEQWRQIWQMKPRVLSFIRYMCVMSWSRCESVSSLWRPHCQDGWRLMQPHDVHRVCGGVLLAVYAGDLRHTLPQVMTVLTWRLSCQFCL